VVVKGYCGDIKVETEEGEFAEFIIILPKHKGHQG
jgi:sensor histidine kinase regulating citrate/malate metabolism